MSCKLCKSTIESQLTTYLIDHKSCIVIVKNVPTMICTGCGGKSYEEDTAKELEKITLAYRNAKTEFAIIYYDDR